MKAVALLCVFVALAVAQTLTPLTGPVTASFTAGSNPYTIHLYTLQLTENMAAIDVQMTPDTTTDCYFYIYASGREFPCGSVWDSESDVIYPCRGNGNSRQWITDDDTFDIYPTYTSQYAMINMASTLYLGVVRYDTDVDNACSYTIAPLISECPVGMAAVGGDNTTCANLTALSGMEAQIMPRTTGDDWLFYRIAIPPMTGSVHLWGNLSTSSTYVYMAQGYIPTSSYYDVEDTGSFSTTGYYTYDLTLYNPSVGYVYIATWGQVDGGSLNVTVNVCPSGMGGWDCSYPTFVTTSISASVNENFNVTNTASDQPMVYYVLNSAPDLSGSAFVNYTITWTSGDYYGYYRKGGFVDGNVDYSYISTDYRYNVYSSHTTLTFALTPADLASGGTYVIGIQNYASTTGNQAIGTLTSAGSAPSTTGSGSDSGTTGSATDASTTGSSASSVAYCFALIALCVAALF